jgi:CheY-like chemotaxis protein
MSNDGILAGWNILLIEDDYLVGLTILELLQEEGATVLGPVGSVDQALLFIAEQAGKVDRVVLDLNLHGEKSYPVADALARSKIPFVFTTGYDVDALEVAYRGYPRCLKPITSAALIAALGSR